MDVVRNDDRNRKCLAGTLIRSSIDQVCVGSSPPDSSERASLSLAVSIESWNSLQRMGARRLQAGRKRKWYRIAEKTENAGKKRE